MTQTKPKTTITALTSPACLSLRYNAACCIPLRHLRNLRENIHARGLNLYCTNEPQCLSQIPLIIADKRLLPHSGNNAVHVYATTCIKTDQDSTALDSTAAKMQTKSNELNNY